ncbi:MAG: PLP-dependent aminotransferase family protein [Propionibacteriaceae bacterium]|jgi:DNA-binding transcriptional MocR family regulator|nr:PLP-dependent aminotransferase family protein [Propionibacteriaceae bacterium]
MASASTAGSVDPFSTLLPLPADIPAWLAVSQGIQRLVAEAKLATGDKLPAERTLAQLLGLSRTTITHAYENLAKLGWVEARQGSGTTVRVPTTDRRPSLPLVPGGDSPTIDLATAAGFAPPATAALIDQALTWLPRSLASAGYEPFGLPYLREQIAAWHTGRGLPTDPNQVIVTAGALAGFSTVLHALAGPAPRVAVDDPTYLGALAALGAVKAKPAAVPLGPAGWDLDRWEDTLRRDRPALAYLMPDFHNPTGLSLDPGVRRDLMRRCARHGCVPVVDEATSPLELDGPLPELRYAGDDPRTVTLSSLSKVLWAGLRIGWIRAPHSLIAPLRDQQVRLGFGAAVLDQLVAEAFFDNPAPVVAEVLDALRATRAAWAAGLADQLPDWNAPQPSGGVALWVTLPEPCADRLAVAAAARDLTIVPGLRFFTGPGGDNRLRLPLTLPAATVPEAVTRLRATWDATVG